jgi:HEAT repeat protein
LAVSGRVLAAAALLFAAGCAERERDTAALIAALRDESTRPEAERALVRAGTGVVDELVLALRDRELCYPVMDVLERIGRDAPGAIAAALPTAADSAKLHLGRVLGRIGEPAVDQLLALLRHPDEAVRAAGVRGVKLLSLAAAGRLAAGLRQETDDVIERAAIAMRGVRPQLGAAVHDLILALGSADEHVSRAAYAMLAFSGAEAVEQLVAALQQEALRVRVVGVLGMMGSDAKAALPALQALADASDPALRAKVEWAVARIGG